MYKRGEKIQALKKNFLSTTVYLGISSTQMKKKKTKPLTLYLKKTTTELKNLKRQTRKAQNKEAKPSWEKR